MKRRFMILLVTLLVLVLGLSACAKTYTAEQIEASMTFTDATVTYDGASHPLAYGGTLPKGLSASYSSENDASEAGTHPVTLTLTNKKGEEVYTKTVNLTISPRVVTLSWEAPASLVYDGTEKSASASVTNLVEGDECQVEVMTTDGEDAVNVGPFTATALSLSNANYTLSGATDLTSPSYYITQGTYDMSGVSLSGASVTYDGSAHPLSILGTLPSGVAVSYSANNDSTDAGTYTVTATFKGSTNYETIATMSATLVIAPREAVLSWTAPSSLVYDGSAKTLSASLTNLVAGDSCTVTTALSSGTNDIHVGSFSRMAVSLSNPNYTLSSSDLSSATYAITPRVATLSWSAPSSLVYDGSAKTLSASLTNLVSGDSCTVTAALSSGMSDVNAGKYSYVAQALSNADYTLTGASVTSASYVITPRVVTLSWSAPSSLVYDGTAKQASATVTNLVKGDSCAVTTATSTGKDAKNAGTFTATATALSNANYTLASASVTSPSYVITPLVVTLSWTAPSSLVYDGSAKHPSASVDGVVTGDECTVTTSLSSGMNNIVVGSFTYQATALSNANYVLSASSLTSETYVITPRVALLFWDAVAGLVYDGTAKDVSAKLTNLVDGDACPVTVSLATGETTNAGSFTYEATSLANANYTLAGAITTSPVFVISARVVILSWTAPTSLVYDGTAKVPSVSITNLVDGDICTVTSTLSLAGDNINAGSFSYEATALSNKNYTLAGAEDLSVIYEIAKAPYDMSGITFFGATVTYDGASHPLSIAGTLPEGVTVTYSANNETTSAGNHVVTASFAGDANHEDITPLTAELVIEKALYDMSGITFSGASVIQDDSSHPLSIAGTLPEGVTVSYSANNQSKAAGTYTVTANFAGDENYEAIASLTATLTIIQISLELSASGSATLSKDVTASSVTITAVLHVGYTWNGWYLNDTLVTTSLSFTISRPLADVSYTAKCTMDADLANFTFIAGPDTLVITHGAWKDSLTIPSSATEIADSAFNYYTNLTTLAWESPSHVVKIGDNAFKNATSLATIAIPDSVMSIGTDAFTGTAWYTAQADGLVYAGKVLYDYKGTMPASYALSIASGTLGIAAGAFNGETNLTTVSAPSTLKIIGTDAFKGTTWQGALASGFTTLGKVLYAYTGTVPTSTSYSVSSGITMIGAGVFKGWTALATVVLPSSLLAIGDEAFSGCTSLVNCTLPSGIITLGASAFKGCTSLTSMTIPSGVSTLAKELFSGDTALESCAIPDGLTTLMDSVFFNCLSLKSVVLPDTVTTIGYYFVSGCSALTTLTLSKNLKSANIVLSDCSSLTSLTLSSSLSSVSLKEFTSLVELNLTKNVASISLHGASSLKSIDLPANLTGIPYYGFENCSSLESIVIPDKVKTLGDRIFANCKSLKSVTLPVALTSVGWNMFDGCTSLEGLELPETLLTIGANFLVNCSSLTSITLPTNLTELPGSCFKGCSSLETIDYPAGLTSIGGSCFEGCVKLKAVALPDSMTTVPARAFYDCASITSLTIPAAVTALGEDAFNGCSRLTELVIPEGVTVIPTDCFERCSGLTSITIPDGVTSIGAYAFFGCTGLTTITIPANVAKIGASAFYGTSLKTMIFTVTTGWKYQTSSSSNVHYGYDASDPVNNATIVLEHFGYCFDRS